MRSRALAAISAAAFVGLAIACSSSSEAPLAPAAPNTPSSLPADGSTLKVSAPVPQSPINDQRLQDTTPPTLRSSASAATFAGAAVPLNYHFQIFNSANALVSEATVNTASWTVTKDLEFNSRHTWRVRAEQGASVGPWSTSASFFTAEGGFIRGSSAFDPLTNGKTVGQQIGGHFVPGQGWQADSLADGINYDIATCGSCTVEFDITNFGKGEGVCCTADLKFLSMGDANAFAGFQPFRDHPWKMHLSQRADGDGTGFDIIWRNGGNGEGRIPGDNRIKTTSGGPDYRGSSVFHFVFDWNPGGYAISVGTDGGPQVLYLQNSFNGFPYTPPNHRVSLGCYPRGETMRGAIWRNFKITPH